MIQEEKAAKEAAEYRTRRIAAQASRQAELLRQEDDRRLQKEKTQQNGMLVQLKALHAGIRSSGVFAQTCLRRVQERYHQVRSGPSVHVFKMTSPS